MGSRRASIGKRRPPISPSSGGADDGERASAGREGRCAQPRGGPSQRSRLRSMCSMKYRAATRATATISIAPQESGRALRSSDVRVRKRASMVERRGAPARTRATGRARRRAPTGSRCCRPWTRAVSASCPASAVRSSATSAAPATYATGRRGRRWPRCLRSCSGIRWAQREGVERRKARRGLMVRTSSSGPVRADSCPIGTRSPAPGSAQNTPQSGSASGPGSESGVARQGVARELQRSDRRPTCDRTFFRDPSRGAPSPAEALA